MLVAGKSSQISHSADLSGILMASSIESIAEKLIFCDVSITWRLIVKRVAER
jgi:hypothetical protein